MAASMSWNALRTPEFSGSRYSRKERLMEDEIPP
jgi:hypothetical protein